MMKDNTKYHHYAIGNVDHSRLSECYVDEKCCELFSNRPIQFYARKGDNYQAHKEIQLKMDEMGITIPIAHVKGSSYLVGSQKQII